MGPGRGLSRTEPAVLLDLCTDVRLLLREVNSWASPRSLCPPFVQIGPWQTVMGVHWQGLQGAGADDSSLKMQS